MDQALRNLFQLVMKAQPIRIEDRAYHVDRLLVVAGP
jgi:hypothetical protein